MTARWICSPDFLGLSPLPILHRERDRAFVPEEHPASLTGHHALFRRRISLGQKPQRAILSISADDLYHLYINGSFVAEGPAPCYHDRCYYTELDVTDYLRGGENILAVEVYYHGLVSRSYTSGDLREGLFAHLTVDGVEQQGEWLCRRSEARRTDRTVGYATAFLEDTDYRALEYGWTEPDYDDSTWSVAPENPADDHVMLMQPTPLIEHISVQPAEIRPIEGGVFLDFGQEITARLYARLTSHAGERLTIRYGEETDGAGRVRYGMRCNCVYEETVTLREGVTELVPFDYKAFRYAELLFDGDTVLDPDSIVALWRRYPIDESYFALSSNDPVLDGITDICRRAVINCTQEAFFDCPQRERGQYLGDLVVTGHSHLILSGDSRQYRKGLLEFAASSRICPGLMAVAPGSYMQEIADYSLLYPYAVLTYYRYTRDLATLREIWPAILGMRDWFRAHVGADGLPRDVYMKWNMVDWPTNLRDGYDFKINDGGELLHMPEPHNVLSALYVGMEKNVAELAQLLGEPADSRFEAARDAFVSAFFDPALGFFVDRIGGAHGALQSNLFPLFFGLVPEGGQAGVLALIRERGLSCGVYTAYFLLHGLAEIGEYGLLWELLRGEGEHSWANMLREGASCAYEAWGKEQKWNTSLCHAWASAPISLVVERIAGLSPDGKGGFVQGEAHLPKGLRLSLTLGGTQYDFG